MKCKLVDTFDIYEMNLWKSLFCSSCLKRFKLVIFLRCIHHHGAWCITCTITVHGSEGQICILRRFLAETPIRYKILLTILMPLWSPSKIFTSLRQILKLSLVRSSTHTAMASWGLPGNWWLGVASTIGGVKKR